LLQKVWQQLDILAAQRLAEKLALEQIASPVKAIPELPVLQ
jgi:hypothetical protein